MQEGQTIEIDCYGVKKRIRILRILPSNGETFVSAVLEGNQYDMYNSSILIPIDWLNKLVHEK